MKKKTFKLVHTGSIIFLLLFQVTVMTGGSIKFSLIDHIPFTRGGLHNYILFFSVTCLVLTLINFLNRARFYQSIGLLFLFFIVAASGISPFIVLATAAISFVTVGEWVCQRLFHQQANDLTFLLVGAGVFGTFIGLWVHLPLNYRGVYLLILLGPMIVRRKEAADICRRWYASSICHPSLTKTDRVLEILIAGLAMGYLAAGMMPEVGHDALAMHLVQPMYVAEHHVWSFDVSWHLMAVMPMLGNWLCTLVFMLSGEAGAKLLVIGFLFLSAGLIAGFTSRYWGRKAACAAVLCFLSCPVVFLVGNSLFIEAFWVSFFLGAVFLFVDAKAVPEKKNPLPLISVLMGFAVSCKLIPLLLIPAILISVLFNWRSCHPIIKVPYVLLGTLGFTLAAAPTYIVAWIKTGNPVFPFYNAIFKSLFYPFENFDNPLFHQGLSWDTLYQALFESQKFLEAGMGATGFSWLLFLPMAVYTAIMKKDQKMFFLGLVGFCFTALVFHSQSYLRYVIPSFALFSVVIAAGIRHAASVSAFTGGTAIFLFAVSIFLNLLFLPSGGWYHRDFPVNTLYDDAQRVFYVSRHAPLRSAVDFVNTLPSSGCAVAVIGDPFIAGLKSNEILMANQYNIEFWNDIRKSADSLQMLQTLNKYNIQTLVVSDHISNDPNVSPEIVKKVGDLLFEITRPLVSYSGVTVRRIRNDLLFKKNLLINGSLSNTYGYHLLPGAAYLPEFNALRVTSQSPAIQNVKVRPGAHYRLKAILICDAEPVEGRLQVNWLDSAGSFIKTDIQVVPCDSNFTHTMDVQAPKHAGTAVVYAAGHTQKPVLFKRLWFLSR